MNEKRYDEMDTKEQLESLKELFLTKFAELEKFLNKQNEITELKIENLKAKDAEHDAKIQALQGQLDGQRSKESEKVVDSWDHVKKSFLSWLVPFAMGLLLLWAGAGFPTPK